MPHSQDKVITMLRVLILCFVTSQLFLVEASPAKFSASCLLGRWYQMYSSLVPRESFQSSGVCNTLDFYDLVTSGSKLSFNATYSQNLNSPRGVVQQTRAVLYAHDATRYPGRFKNVYNEALLQVETTVLVKAFGAPEEGESNYPWVILSSPNKIYAYILVRDPHMFDTTYREDVLKLAWELGFNEPLNEPIRTFQSDACAYSNFLV